MTVRKSTGESPFTQGARAPRPSAFAQYRALLAKDVRQELRTRGKDVLLAILFIPVAFPLLYACVSATGVALAGGEGACASSCSIRKGSRPVR